MNSARRSCDMSGKIRESVSAGRGLQFTDNVDLTVSNSYTALIVKPKKTNFDYANSHLTWLQCSLLIRNW